MAKGGPWDKKKRLRSTKLKAPGNPALKVEAESNPREELELCVHVGVGVGWPFTSTGICTKGAAHATEISHLNIINGP